MKTTTAVVLLVSVVGIALVGAVGLAADGNAISADYGNDEALTDHLDNETIKWMKEHAGEEHFKWMVEHMGEFHDYEHLEWIAEHMDDHHEDGYHHGGGHCLIHLWALITTGEDNVEPI